MRRTVYEFVKMIPSGRVATYGQIAAYLGNPHLARVVGSILHNNPDPATIPCHRVVNSQGKVASHFAFGGAKGQREKLEREGIIFEPNGSIDLAKYGISLKDIVIPCKNMI